MEIINYTPSKKDGNLVGYAAVRFPESKLVVEVAIMKNSKTGSLFASLPSRKYVGVDGSDKYAYQVRFDKDVYEQKQKEIIDAFQSYLSMKQSSLHLNDNLHKPTSMDEVSEPLPF